ncbi:MAG: AAA family ATPase [Candidatus Poseidoniales archaeon]
MKLQHLILYNIGPFKGRHSINFQSSRGGNGYAFFAENNRGKTSVYNAMKWGLFGDVSERAKTIDGKRRSGLKIPIVGEGRILMNDRAYKHDDPQEMSVMLLAEGDKGKIQITRTVRSRAKFARRDDELEMSLDVKIGDNPILHEIEAQKAIESFFPRELERFFFIDGEALEEYTDMMRSSALEGLKEEVNAVLGIPALTRGVEDLSSLRATVKSKIDQSMKADKASSKAFDDANKQRRILQEKQRNMAKIESYLQTVVEKLNSTKSKMKEVEELTHVMNELKVLETQIKLKKESLAEAAAAKVSEAKVAWKVVLWKKASQQHDEFTSIFERVQRKERTVQQTKEQITNLQTDLDEMTGICSECLQPLPDLEAFKAKKQAELVERKEILQRLNQETPVSTDELTIKIGDLRKLKPKDDAMERIKTADEKWLKLKNEITSLEEKHRDLDSRLTEDAKANAAELGEKKGRQETMVAQRESELIAARSEVEKAEFELRRLEGLTGKTGTKQEDIHLEDIFSKLIVAAKDSINDYREEARKMVGIRATEVFSRLNNAPEVYTSISVDKDFKTQILNSKGQPARNPSSGAISIMTMSVIDALRHVSGLDVPVFLDTPGRSLDEHHKERMLEYFWNSDSQQFLIFAHSGEYALEKTIKNYKERLVKAFTISLPRDHESCYDIGCGSDNVTYDPYKKTRTCEMCGNIWDTSSQDTLILEVPL